MTKVHTLVAIALSLVTQVLPAQPALEPAQEQTHQELRELRDRMLAAVNSSDLDGVIALLHTNVVITWHNAEVSRGHAGVRDYFHRVVTGPDKLVESFECEVTVDELTVLHPGGTGISFGSSDERFLLRGGKSLNVQGRWTATLLKENGRWLVTSLHASTNLFDNVLLSIAKQMLWVTGGAALLAGVIIGWWLGRRRKSASVAAA